MVAPLSLCRPSLRSPHPSYAKPRHGICNLVLAELARTDTDGSTPNSCYPGDAAMKKVWWITGPGSAIGGAVDGGLYYSEVR
jgi:hypothetical protein